MALQFAHPDWGTIFDVAPDQAAATRAAVLVMAATDRLLVAGMHLNFPGLGHVAKSGTGFAFVPAQWDYTL